MLVYLGICAVVAFLAALAAAFFAVLPAPTFGCAGGCLSGAVLNAPASAIHIAFAGGAMPLIFGAIIHFVPVLTRTAMPHRVIRLLPLLVQGAGICTPLALGGVLPYVVLHAAAGAVSLAAVILTFWIARRLRNTLGAPHPGARWYGAALLCLFFAVSIVPAWLVQPELRAALRLFHLHLNTLGFIGLAALGTLPVLLPTALGRPESTAGPRLRSDLLPAAVGAVLLAAGTLGAFWLSVAGTLLLLWVVVRNLRVWQSAYGRQALLADGAAAPLVAATLGLAGLLVAGIAHGAGWLVARSAIVGFAAAFLLPLVTGALSQLLPVWCHPGPASPRRHRMHALLTWGGEWRALLFLFGGATLVVDSPLGAWPLILGLLWFFALLVAAFTLDRPQGSDDNSAPNQSPPPSALP